MSCGLIIIKDIILWDGVHLTTVYEMIIELTSFALSDSMVQSSKEL